MELELIRLVQSAASPALDQIFLFFTLLGEAWLPVLLVAVIYWAYNKRFGEFLGYCALFSLAVNCLVKNVVQRPRPIGEEGIRSLRTQTATGSSFPSGHSQSAASLFATLSYFVRKHWFTALAVVIPVLVGFSRIYLGVHYPTDVLAGLLLGFLIPAVCYFLYVHFSHNNLLMVASAIIAGVLSWLVPSDDFSRAAALMAGFTYGIIIEQNFIRFSVDGPFLRRILRVALGLALLGALAVGMKLVFPVRPLFTFLRYGLIAFTATAIYPAIFKKLNL